MCSRTGTRFVRLFGWFGWVGSLFWCGCFGSFFVLACVSLCLLCFLVWLAFGCFALFGSLRVEEPAQGKPRASDGGVALSQKYGSVFLRMGPFSLVSLRGTRRILQAPA